MHTDLTNTVDNFEALCAMVTTMRIGLGELRSHIDGLKALEITREFYGDQAPAARLLLAARVTELEYHYADLRSQWQLNLDDLKEGGAIPEEAINPSCGPELLRGLTALEEAKESGFREESFGDLMDEAVRVRDERIAAFKRALSRVALMIVDPDSVPSTSDQPLEVLEFALERSKALPLTLDAFSGDADMLAEAKRRHPLWIAKQEKLVAAVRAKQEAEHQQRLQREVASAIEERDEKEHRNRINVASLTAEQRGARTARMIEAVEPMYDILLRVTEITTLKEERGVGVIDGDGLIEVAQRADAMVQRVEGRLN
jgi:hypothetical protein